LLWWRGFWDKLGIIPSATFDWKVSNSGALVTPFCSDIQQYAARALSGLTIRDLLRQLLLPSIHAHDQRWVVCHVYDVNKILTDKAAVDVKVSKAYESFRKIKTTLILS
jgi:hypothetical protein